MKLWKLIVKTNNLNGIIVTPASYYCGTFESVSAYINAMEHIKFNEPGIVKTPGDTWILCEIEDFTFLGQTIHESLQTNVVD